MTEAAPGIRLGHSPSSYVTTPLQVVGKVIFRLCVAAPLGAAGWLTVDGMTAQPTDSTGPFEVIHLGGEAAAIVPLADLRRLRALERHAPAEVLEDAEIEATIAGHDHWARAGRPGARPHDDVMGELLGGR
jgi:hypothetical protein